MSAGLGERPSAIACAPGFPAVQIICRPHDTPGYIRVKVHGWPDDIAAAGILPLAALRVNAGRKPRMDKDGTRWRGQRYWRLRQNGRRAPYWCIDCNKPIVLVMQMPGGREAIEAYERYCAWERGREAIKAKRRADFGSWVDELFAVGAKPSDTLTEATARMKRPKLALVVDNTREGSQ